MEKSDLNEPLIEMTPQELAIHRQARIDALNRIAFYDWFDKLPPFHRDFINDYGFAVWFQIRDQMNGSGFAFDTKLNSWRTHHPPLNTGVVE